MLDVQEPLTIYSDTRKALHRLRLRCLCIGLPVVLLTFGMLSLSPFPAYGFLNMMRWILLAEIPVLYLLVSRKLKQQSKPIVTLSSQGMTIHTICTQMGFLRWDEIKDVYTYSLGYRFVGITLNDPKTVWARVGLKRSWLMQTNRFVAPLYRPFGIRVAPINIPQEYLPMSADELLAQINAYRAMYS